MINILLDCRTIGELQENELFLYNNKTYKATSKHDSLKHVRCENIYTQEGIYLTPELLVIVDEFALNFYKPKK